jgi:CHASE1-domain containing sensor protein
MADDPFDRFERSPQGLLIPLGIFLVGALLTLAAMRLLNQLEQAEQRRELAPPAAVGKHQIEKPIRNLRSDALQRATS